MSIHLQRRPHTRKALPVVIEMDEGLEDIQSTHSRRRPRPAPIFTPYHGLPILFDAIESTKSPLSCIEKDPDFSLSPSLLFSRRKSETVLEFPVPAKHTPQTSASPDSTPPRYSSPSPVSSNSSSSSYPDTPLTDSEEERQNLVDDVFAGTTVSPSVYRQPYRTPSALSLKSFATAEFDAHAASIYNLLRSSPASPPPNAPLPTRPRLRPEVSAIPSEAIAEDWVDVDSELVRIPRLSPNNVERRPSIVLSVRDGLTEATVGIPFVMEGNFLDIDVSDEDSEDIEFECDEAAVALFPALNLTDGLASSDEESDEKYRRQSRLRIIRPNRAYDPDMTHQTVRKGAMTKPQFLVIPSLSSSSPSSSSSRSPVAPAPSPVPSVQSSFSSRLVVPPRESIVPRDIDFDDLTSPVDNIRISIPVPQERRTTPSPKPAQPHKPHQTSASPIRFISPFTSSQLLEDDNDADDDEPDFPILRSRFSSSTLNSFSEPSQSSPLASPGRFLSRLLRSPTSPVTSKHAPPIPSKNSVRGNTFDIQPLKYRKSPTNGTRSSSLQPSPPGRRPSKSLELYDKPLPYASTRNDLSSNQKQHPGQQVSSSSPKHFPSRSSLDTAYSVESGSGNSVLSAGSSSSIGLKRPPIPIELFIKH